MGQISWCLSPCKKESTAKCTFQSAETWASVAEVQPGWTGNSWWSSYTKGKNTEDGHTQEKYRSIAQVCRDGIREVKTQLELKLERDVKGREGLL